MFAVAYAINISIWASVYNNFQSYFHFVCICHSPCKPCVYTDMWSTLGHIATESEIQNLSEMPYMFVTCCYHISTHYLERQTQVASLLCVHCGWSSLLRKLLSAMMKLSWLVAVFWFKGFIPRYGGDHICIMSFWNLSSHLSPFR